MTKTSTTHPLRIATIRLDQGGGAVGLTFCPGKRQPDALTGPWDRDLHRDLEVVQDWGAQAVVTLMEGFELAKVGVPHLGEAVEALGLDWHHLPIRDVDVPGPAFEQAWTTAGHRLRRILMDGGRVLVHCRGGLGRAGTIASRLLIEMGWSPDRAIAAVRAVRPGAIETPAQEDYVRAQRPPPTNADWTDRMLGCLWGGAVGDAFGYAVEFTHADEIRRRYGPAGLRDLVLQDGRAVVSDDTQITLFTLEGLLAGLATGGSSDHDGIIEAIRCAYLDWFVTQGNATPTGRQGGRLIGYKVMHQRQAPGTTCMSALAQGATGTVARPINTSKGCGGVMRVAPLGLWLAWDADTAFELAVRAAALTHGHPGGYVSAGALAYMLRRLLDGDDLGVVALAAADKADGWSGGMETAALIRQGVALAAADGDPWTDIATIGEGWVGDEALGIALYAALRGADFTDVLAISANHDGDSDSTASIAGQLYGAWKGARGLPQRWIRRLDVVEPMMELLAKFNLQ